MLGTAMATSALYQPDGCVSEERDPCASPPCKRLKQAALPVECIILEDSTDANTNPFANRSSTSKPSNLPPNQENINEDQLANNKQNIEQCLEVKNVDVTLMETDNSFEESIKNQQANPPLPCMDGLPETKPDQVENSNCVNGSPLNSSKSDIGKGSKYTKPSPKPVKNGLLPSSQLPKGSGTLFRFLKPVTPDSKTAAVEQSKTPSKDDVKAPSNGCADVVGSPCTPVNTKTSPDGSVMVANGETPSPGTVSSNDMKTTTPRRKTPGRKLSVEEKLKREEERLRKQKEKEALEQERVEKRKERERLKEEKQKERMEAKQKKEQREKERVEKKEQEEKERKEKMEKKEDEKRKKEEERKKKEDEKNLKNEEKRKKEQEEMLKKQKAKNSFASFFIKKEVTATPKPKEQIPKEAKFQPFELKPFMKLASTPYRKPLSDDDKQLLSKHLVEQAMTSLRHVKDELFTLGELAREIKLEENKTKLSCTPEKNEDEIMIIDDDLSLDLKTTETTTKHEVNKVKGKLLQFHENYRPAYFGSWRKKSSNVGPRTPLKKDKDLLNYDVDSDDEWEEEEPGESLSNSEGEDEEDQGCPHEDEEQDGFFVPHGYLSDDEGDGNDEVDGKGHSGGEKLPQSSTADDKMERHLAKQKTWEAELKRQFKPMKPIAIGCIWDDEIPAILKQLEACCLLANGGSIDPTCAKKEYQEPAVTSSPNTTYCNTAMPVPEEAMAFLIELVHGSEAGLKKLVRLFRKRWTLTTKKEDSHVSEENWESHCTVSKRQVEKKIISIANKELRSSMPKSRWYVQSNILALYKLENIALTEDSKGKSPSPVLVQTKSPITASFTNVKDKSEKPNASKTQETAPKSTNIEVTSMDTTPPVRLE